MNIPAFRKYVFERVSELSRVDPTKGELLSATVAIVWGAWLLLPFKTFEASPVYAGISFLSEETWGGILFGVGIVQVATLFAPTHRYTLRRTSSFIITVLYLIIGAAFVMAVPPAAAGVIILALSASTFWSFVQLQLIKNRLETARERVHELMTENVALQHGIIRDDIKSLSNSTSDQSSSTG